MDRGNINKTPERGCISTLLYKVNLYYNAIKQLKWNALFMI